MPDRPIEKRIRRAGVLVCLGLSVLLVSLLWTHPLSFMLFLAIGCPLIMGGVLLFLYSLVAKGGSGKANVF